MMNINCPCCLGNNIEDFYTVKNAPVQSVVTIKSKERALAIPRQDIVLTFCKNCGFIFNSSFDDKIDFFENGYEDQQGYSKTFNKFITDITTKFINKYGVFEKDILEIGCGKGDFLKLICELGNNRGIGIDPAFVQGRIEPNPNISFIKEFYSEDHSELPKDVITCRHTLEHIHNPNQFFKILCKSLENQQEVLVLMEVPSVVRILKKQAFWDIFYEHCCYFSPGSLARLFKLHNFEVLNLYLGFNDQYLFIEARPAKKESKGIHAFEETVEELRIDIENFVFKTRNLLKDWELRLVEMKKQNKKVVLWGGGSKAIGFLTHFEYLDLINYVVDINPNIQGNFIPGIGIKYVQPVFLKEYKPDSIIIMNGFYENEISRHLSRMELFPELISL